MAGYSNYLGYQLSQDPSMGLNSGLSPSDIPSAEMGAGGSSMFASASPWILGAQLGLGLLQQKAMDERARREREAQIAMQSAGNEVGILNNLSSYWGRALKR